MSAIPLGMGTPLLASETVVSWGRNNYFTRHLLSRPERRDVTTIFQEKINICLYMWHRAIPKEYVKRRNFVVGTLTKFMCAESKDLTEYHASTHIAILCHMKVSNCFKNHCKVHNLMHLHRIQCTAEYNVKADRIQSCSSLFKVVAKNVMWSTKVGIDILLWDSLSYTAAVHWTTMWWAPWESPLMLSLLIAWGGGRSGWR